MYFHTIDKTKDDFNDTKSVMIYYDKYDESAKKIYH